MNVFFLHRTRGVSETSRDPMNLEKEWMKAGGEHKILNIEHPPRAKPWADARPRKKFGPEGLNYVPPHLCRSFLSR